MFLYKSKVQWTRCVYGLKVGGVAKDQLIDIRFAMLIERWCKRGVKSVFYYPESFNILRTSEYNIEAVFI